MITGAHSEIKDGDDVSFIYPSSHDPKKILKFGLNLNIGTSRKKPG